MRVIILAKSDITLGNKRRLDEALGVVLNFNLTFTQEDFSPYTPANVDRTVDLLTNNFIANTFNGTFVSILRTELEIRGAAETFIITISPAVPEFQSGAYVDQTGLNPTMLPTIIPSRTPTSKLCLTILQKLLFTIHKH